ncbi:unnamed protein product, partial [Owenia fusiformis]
PVKLLLTKGGATRTKLENNSSDYYSSKYQLTPLTIDEFKPSKKSACLQRKCLLIILLVVAAVAVALAIGLGVHFGRNQSGEVGGLEGRNSTRTTEKVVTIPSSTTVTTEEVVTIPSSTT